MDERQHAERLADAIDRVLLEGGQPAAQDPGLAPLLSLGAELQAAMPPVQASPSFQASLRARLVAQRRAPWWRRTAGRLFSPWVKPPHRSFRARPWRYALAFAAILVAVGGGSLWLRAPSVSPPPALPSQSGLLGGAATDRAGARTAVRVPSPPPPATEARNAGPAALATSPGAALPALPPLRASSPIMMAYGRGGGGAAGVEPASTAPQLRLELAISMPELPSVATVYRYRQPSTDPEKLKRLAAQLGLDPAGLQPMADASESWVVHDPSRGSLSVQGSGGPILYHAALGSQGPDEQAARPLLEDARAAEVATRWLAERNLLPEESGPPRVFLPHPRAPFKEVVFRPAEPAGIATPDPQIKVGVDAEGRVVSLFAMWPERESALSYPARTAESAWQLVQSGKAVTAVGDQPLPSGWRGSVRVTGVEQGYALTFALDGRPYLQPVVMFRGESTAEGEAIPRPFTAQVPLVADSALPPERVGYVLLGSLPSTPEEAAAIERAGAPPPTREWVRELARKLGLSGEPRPVEEGVPGAPVGWEVSDPSRWTLRVMGDTRANSWSESWILRRDRAAPEAGPAGGKVPTGQEAIRIAEEFLRSRGLLTPDLGRARVQPADQGGTVSTVVFQGEVEGLPFGDGGVVTVMLNRRGDVEVVISNQRPWRVVRRGKLLAPAEALEALQMGKGAIDVPSRRGEAIYSDRAEIEQMDLAYRLQAPKAAAQRPGLPGGEPLPQRYEPYYRFSGTIELGESRLRVPFTAWLPAWAP